MNFLLFLFIRVSIKEKKDYIYIILDVVKSLIANIDSNKLMNITKFLEYLSTLINIFC